MTTIQAARMPAADAIRHVEEHGAAIVLDVRTPIEIAAQGIPAATCIPLGELTSRLEEVRAICGPKLLLCQSGARATKAKEQLTDAGIVDVTVIDGGVAAWAAAGGRTEQRRAVMSLERQVRISAGLLVLAGLLLGWLVHPGFFGLSAFVGAGLVFAGLTDWCGMGLLLARMPWNRVQP